MPAEQQKGDAMYTNLVFIGYIIAMFLSLLCLTLILVVLAGKDFGKERPFSGRTFTCRSGAGCRAAAGIFAVTIFLTGVLYFIFYYRETVQNQFELALPFRVADYVLCCLLPFTWLLLLRQLTDSEKNGDLLKAASSFTITRMAVSIAVTYRFMGPYYEIEMGEARNLWHMFQIFFISGALFLLIRYGIYGIQAANSPLKRRYIIICTVLLAAMDIEQSFIEMGLAEGKYGISAWALEVPDMTGTIVFLLSLATLLFVFKEDFSPLFFRETPESVSESQVAAACSGELPGADALGTVREQEAAQEEHKEATKQKQLDLLAERYGLTAREREVMELVYEGYTNPEISQELYISVNTVKKHLQHTYEKLGANSRMEVLRLINEQNHPPG